MFIVQIPNYMQRKLIKILFEWSLENWQLSHVLNVYIFSFLVCRTYNRIRPILYEREVMHTFDEWYRVNCKLHP